MHLKQWYYSLHRDFQNCYSTRRSPTGFFSSNYNSNSARVPIQHTSSMQHPHLHVHIQRILHPEIQFYMQKTKNSSSTTTTLQIPVSSDSTHRRQGDLLEMHPCVLQDLPVTFQAFSHKSLQRQLQLLQLLQRHSSLSRHSRHSSLSSLPDTPVAPDTPETFQTFQSLMTFQPLQAILQILHCSSISRDSTPFQHSPIRMHILQFYNSYSSIGFHRNSIKCQLNNTNYKHSTDITFFKEREML